MRNDNPTAIERAANAVFSALTELCEKDPDTDVYFAHSGIIRQMGMMRRDPDYGKIERSDVHELLRPYIEAGKVQQISLVKTIQKDRGYRIVKKT